MIRKLFNSYTKDRKWYVNLLFCIFALFGILLLPSVFALLLNEIFKNKYLCSILGEIIFVIILFAIYYKDLVKEFKIFTSNFSKNFKISLKYYITGVMLMMALNIIIFSLVKNISQNESQVRELLFSHTTYMLISIVIIAPLTEELVFRKSLWPVIKNKWIYSLVSGILFGGAHIMTNVFSGTFVFTDLLFILPYGSFGFMFALMDRENKTTFSSIMMHAIHNLLNGIMLLEMHFIGVL